MQPRSGLAAKHGISIVNTPGLVDSGYRGELRVALLNTDARETFVVEPGMRIAQLVVAADPRGRPGRGRGAARVGARRARLRLVEALMGHEPRVRVSLLLRWQGRVLLCRQEKPGKEYWLLPGGGVEAGETLRRRCSASSARSSALGHGPARRPDRGRRVDRPGLAAGRPPRRPHHLRRRPLEPLAGGRRVQDPVIRGARLFSLDELQEIVLHPPMKRFVERWLPGDPAVYLGSLWAR